ncbi:GATOR complex protein Iml1-like isoform X2 [Mytilus californianus]|uniref:GATOR complex protein Iml1-like isoform X2 n=1 Tax=Mytilus californianus TaxID=6549 RepID=UPI002246886F|nr:GATOR complex protein Iml1-like isoform X2 [Mytilus californianus]
MENEKIKKLHVHKRNPQDAFLGNDILINPKDFPDVVLRDILEIHHSDSDNSRLLLQVTTVTEEFQQKDTISIEHSIANSFHLKAYNNVVVKKVDPKAVALDLVELLFKDQYFSRSDFWRLRDSLSNTCAYLNKKLEAYDMRAQVYELWSKGERVTCGVINSDTRVVFRSSTSVVQIFIQMSSEMWDFDLYGDLYIEKAVDGFLTDLFAKWKDQNCLHDVSIVLFSRTFYEAQYIEEFPVFMRDCLQVDYMGRFYEDFYRIIIQNERYEDWTTTIKKLRKCINQYQDYVLKYHERPGEKIPKAYNSTAAQGNFLETLNMTLNLFEKYYFDRNFDRTGKVAVVITPGPGVFEVDRQLTNITKQRTIDCGVGSDLVCMGEQPLHAAPLFKFHSKSQKSDLEVGDDYNIPHWMNHSFYISKHQIEARLQGSFVPRIKPPPEIFKPKPKSKERTELIHSPQSVHNDEDNFPFVDYDEYDAQIFKVPVPSFGLGERKRIIRYQSNKNTISTLAEAKRLRRPRDRHISDDFAGLALEKSEGRSQGTRSPAINIPRSPSGEEVAYSVGCYPVIDKKLSFESTDSEETIKLRPRVGSAGSPVSHSRAQHHVKSRRALINPFAPSRMQFKMTSYRRRWVHAFPRDLRGAAVQTHHIHTSTTDAIEEEHCLPTPEVLQGAHLALEARKTKLFSRQSSNDFVDGPGNEGRDSGGSSLGLSPLHSSYQGNNDPHWPSSTGSSVFMQDLGLVSGRSKSAKDKSYLWGPTGEQEWSPEMTTGTDWRPAESHRNIQSESCLIKPLLGTDFQSKNFCAGISVDWKSLTMPASLPITTDYFPGKQSLTNDYVVSDYNLLPEDVNFDMNQSDSDKINPKKPLSTVQVFRELISSRLAQGFQIIVLPASTSPVSQSKLVPGQQYSMGLMRARPRQEPSEEYHLSIGRIFHKIRRVGSTITVTRYRPRHEQPALSYSYRYRFKVPDSLGYDVSWSEFKNEKLENYNWNYFDQYICTHGEGDFGLLESLKFWRSRFLLLPINIPATKKIIDGNDRCDIYQEISDTDTENFVHGFIRYLETLNKLKRTSQERRLKNSGDQVQSPAPPQGETTKQSDTQQTRQKETITASTPSTKIAEIMVDNQFGLPLLSKQPGLPHNCFIAEEAVNWCVQEVDGIKTITAAILLMQRLIDDQVIVHASGNPKHKFIYGFYLYCVIPNKEKAPEFLVYNSTFENEWCEVVVSVANRKEPKDKFHLGDDGPSRPYDNIIDPENDDWRTQTGLSFRSQGWGQQSDTILNIIHNATLTHKYVSVDVDFNGRSDRPEWATARYHAYYSPHCAWELELQWVVATGSILAELVSTWYRKARPCGFQFLPVPVDPFALPTAPDSDPLRGPIFLPLNIACMSNGGKGIFHGYDQDIKTQKLKHFQQSIIKRYGFMPFSVMAKPSGYPPSPNPSSSSSSPSQNEEQYVHCSGGMFVLIEDSQTTSPTMKEAPFVYGHKKKSASQLRKDYIARQTSRTNQHDDQHWNKIGFLWSWNYMLSKKWRTSHTGDEHFQDKMLADFREFCSNKDDRLKEYWHDYKLDNPV